MVILQVCAHNHGWRLKHKTRSLIYEWIGCVFVSLHNHKFTLSYIFSGTTKVKRLSNANRITWLLCCKLQDPGDHCGNGRFTANAAYRDSSFTLHHLA